MATLEEKIKHISAYIVDVEEEDTVTSQEELTAKITKINQMLDTVNNKIETHEKSLGKLQKLDEKQKARDQIARLTQKILTSS